MAVVQRKTLIDRIRDVFATSTGDSGATAAGIFRVSGTTYYNATGWEFTRIANSVYANPTGYRCVEAIVANYSRPAWEIRSAKDPAQVIANHRLLGVLNQPSPMVSGTMMQRDIARDKELMGKSFWLKMQGTDGFGMTGPVSGLRRLPPQRVTVVGNQDDELLGFIYTDRAGRREPMLPETVVYLRFPHPERNFDGLPPAVMAGLPAEADTSAARFNYDLLSNDAALPGYVSVEGMTKDQFAEAKAAWEAGEVPGKTRFLGGRAQYVKIGQTNQELMYDKLRRQMEDDILRSFGVPRAVAFDVEDTTYANADAEKAMFMQQNILPKWVLDGDELTNQLGASEGVLIRYRLNEIDELQEAPTQVVDRLVKLRDGQNVTINWMNKELGLPSVPWGDEPSQPVGAMKPVPGQPAAELVDFERALSIHEARGERKLTRFFERQAGAIASRFESGGKGKALSRYIAAEGSAPWFDRSRWDQELETELHDLFHDTADGVGTRLQAAIRLEDPKVQQQIGDRSREAAATINATTERELRALLERLDGEAGLPVMVAAIRDYFSAEAPKRAQTFAQSELAALVRGLGIEGAETSTRRTA